MEQERRDNTVYARLARLGPGKGAPEIVRTLVEIPKGSRNKYEMDEETGLIRLDRNLYTASVYPGDYGFIPGTLSEDGDPLDILIVSNEPTFSGCLIDARVVGVFYMVDGGKGDEKILAVPNRDPLYAEIEDSTDLPKHKAKMVEHFFMTYKQLEGGQTSSRGWGHKDEALKIVEESIERYAEKAIAQRD